MPPLSFVFDRLVAEVERRVEHSIADGEVESAPLEGLGVVDKAVNDVFGSPNTQEALVIMSSIGNIDEYPMDTRDIAMAEDVATVLQSCLNTLIGHRLAATRDRVAALSFAAGFPEVAGQLVAFAETAVAAFPQSKRIDAQSVAATREAFDRISDRSANRADLETVLRAPVLLRELSVIPKDKAAWSRHGLEVDAVQRTMSQFKAFRDMLGYGWKLADTALAAIAERPEIHHVPKVGEKVVAPSL